MHTEYMDVEPKVPKEYLSVESKEDPSVMPMRNLKVVLIE